MQPTRIRLTVRHQRSHHSSHGLRARPVSQPRRQHRSLRNQRPGSRERRRHRSQPRQSDHRHISRRLLPAKRLIARRKINSLANLLNTCTAATSTSGCTPLFTATTPTGGSAPTNTLDAALNLVRNPGTNVAALYTQSTASTAFTPALTTAPSDWTMFINFTGGGMNSPSGVGVDATGNVWVASYFSAASKFSPTGNPTLPNGNHHRRPQ